MILNILSSLFSTWAAQVATLSWLGVAFVAAILEVSIPHFGSAFVSAGAIAAAAAAYLGFGVPLQIATFVVVMVVSLVALRSSLVGHLAGPGVPSRTAAADRTPRHRDARHRSDTRHRPRERRRRRLGGAEHGRDRRRAPRCTVVGADGIVLEVRRA